MKLKLSLLLAILLFSFSLAMPVEAQGGIQASNNRVAFDFPNTIAFNAEFQSSSKISSVVLQYGVDQLTCGTVIAEAFPDFTPSTDVKVSWTWDLRQSGTLPPGADLWWSWQVTDSGGAQFTSPRQTAIWLDSQHDWQTLSGGDINLHWYSGGKDYAQQLHDSAVQALQRLTQDIGVGTDRPVDLYIYANQDDLRAAILYSPSWTGGEAYPEDDIVVIEIPTSELDWGKSTEAHELTHVLVGHETFSCLSFVPQWLNEGLAMYGQGGPDPGMQSIFNSALASNTLATVRSLSGNFPEASDAANLAYGESFSLVNFLIQQYGRDKMTALLLSLKNGSTADQALQSVYGFDQDGLDAAWRASIGAPARGGNAQATPVPTPTIIATFQPITGQAGDLSSVTLTPAPTSSSSNPAALATSPAGSSAFGSTQIAIVLAVVCCLLILLILVVILGVVVRRPGRSK